jgi:hypothetical protein
MCLARIFRALSYHLKYRKTDINMHGCVERRAKADLSTKFRSSIMPCLQRLLMASHFWFLSTKKYGTKNKHKKKTQKKGTKQKQNTTLSYWIKNDLVDPICQPSCLVKVLIVFIMVIYKWKRRWPNKYMKNWKFFLEFSKKAIFSSRGLNFNITVKWINATLRSGPKKFILINH